MMGNNPINEIMIDEFRKGIILNDGICKTAILERKDTYIGIVTLTEGRYHQIKRMFGCFGAKVVNLKRIAIGNLLLPNALKQGECKELTEKEISKIIEKINTI